MAQRMLVLLGSTYICEQTFRLMNFNKLNHRYRLTDAHLKSVLTIATTKLTPDFDTLKRGLKTAIKCNIKARFFIIYNWFIIVNSR